MHPLIHHIDLLFPLPLFPIAADSSSGGVVSNAPPSFVGIYIAAVLTLASGVLLFLLQGERDRRKNENRVKENNDTQMAAINQSLALLLSHQSVTDTELVEHAGQLRALETKSSGYDISLALLRQAIETHIATSEEDRRNIHDKVESMREGLRNSIYGGQQSDRRANPRRERE